MKQAEKIIFQKIREYAYIVFKSLTELVQGLNFIFFLIGQSIQIFVFFYHLTLVSFFIFFY